MDTLASIGRGLSTFQFVVSIFAGFVFIAIGIYLLVSQVPVPPSKPGSPPHPSETENLGRRAGGGIMVGLGILIPIAGWYKRKLIRTNPGVAAVAGVFDIEEGLKILF